MLIIIDISFKLFFMEFVHEPYYPGETIVAIATPQGEGGVAIIRVSGKEAFSKVQPFVKKKISSIESHKAHFCKLYAINGEHLDDVLLLPFQAPKSYTGEDTIEIHCHGGRLITRRVLEALIASGIRGAKPGEFTFKAFMNGKIDLSQAEAVQEMIHAKNEFALNAATEQLEGALSQKIGSFQESLTEIAAILEAWVDFPDEGLEFASIESVCETLQKTEEKMRLLSETYHEGRLIHDGISLCLVGRPNVGKSSLMNALLDHDRAIVTDIAGTTRDILEADLRLNGLNVRLIDTAGIRETEEIVEKEGVRRSKIAMEKADIVLFVLDQSAPLQDEDHTLFKLVPKNKTLLIWNKNDLSKVAPLDLGLPFVSLSAKEKRGLEELHKKIDHLLFKHERSHKEEVLIANVRHKEALDQAIISCQMVREGLQTGLSAEFVTSDMRECLHHLGVIIGKNITDEILTSIFSKFCIGK
jgi:tRNA modification GTPase